MKLQSENLKSGNAKIFTGKFYVGCSGFYYNEWKGIFYPDGLAKNKWFEYYCTKFNTLELNSTFYRFPRLSTLKKWYDSSPGSFKFSVKVPKAITHFRRFNDCDSMMESFYNTCSDGLGEKLGCILFQLHPHIQYSKENLQKIFHLVDLRFKNVVEFRHESWWRPEVIRALSSNDISFCSISYPGLPDHIIVSSFTHYYRFHGVPVLYKSAYRSDFLKKIFDSLKSDWLAEEVWIYFNNTWGSAALQNANSLLEWV